MRVTSGRLAGCDAAFAAASDRPAEFVSPEWKLRAPRSPATVPQTAMFPPSPAGWLFHSLRSGASIRFRTGIRLGAGIRSLGSGTLIGCGRRRLFGSVISVGRSALRRSPYRPRP